MLIISALSKSLRTYPIEETIDFSKIGHVIYVSSSVENIANMNSNLQFGSVPRTLSEIYENIKNHPPNSALSYPNDWTGEKTYIDIPLAHYKSEYRHGWVAIAMHISDSSLTFSATENGFRTAITKTESNEKQIAWISGDKIPDGLSDYVVFACKMKKTSSGYIGYNIGVSVRGVFNVIIDPKIKNDG